MNRWIALTLIVLLTLPYTITLVKAQGVGYLAIKDYLGRVWTYEDIQKIKNAYFNTPNGTASLGDYILIIVDNTTRYKIDNFTIYPEDGSTAVLPLPAGEHYIEFVWFGYRQRQYFNIVENALHIMSIDTAPVLPLTTASGSLTGIAEWDLVSNPDGLLVQRRDGNAKVRFAYNQSYIEVSWYDSSAGWNYNVLNILLDSKYTYSFHITDPANPVYSETKTGSFLWLNWDVYKIQEKVSWNRTDDILHVQYIVGIAYNIALLKAVDDFITASNNLLESYKYKLLGIVVPGAYGYSLLLKTSAFVNYAQSFYDSYAGVFFAKNYQKTIIMVWDVFATPTQLIILAHCYEVDANGNLIPHSITSNNAFTINNRLVYVRRFAGGLSDTVIFYTDDISGTWAYYTVSPGIYQDIVVEAFSSYGPMKLISLPILREYYLDDLSMYDYELWYSGPVPISFKLIMRFDDPSKATIFKQQLDTLGTIQYTYDNSTQTFTFTTSSSKLVIVDWDNIEKYIPPNSSGSVRFYFDPVLGRTGCGGWYKLYYHVEPKLLAPRISILKDGYITVNRAYAVQVYTDLYKQDSDVYILGYYVLNNTPPPSYVVRDVYYDVQSDVMHYVYSIISVDCYGRDIAVLNNATKIYPSNMMLKVDELTVYSNSVYTVNYGYDSYQIRMVLYNGTTIDIPLGTTTYYGDLSITPDMIRYVVFKYKQGNGVKILIASPQGYVGGVLYSLLYNNPYPPSTITINNPPALKYYISIAPGIRTIDNVVFALFSFSRMAFLNLAPEIIQYLLAVPPTNDTGYGTPIVDWSTITLSPINTSRPFALYYYDKSISDWVQVSLKYYNDTKVYDILKYSDNSTLVETLPPGNMSKYYYKLVYTDTSETYYGWLYNDNGTLKLLQGKVYYTLTQDQVQQILQQLQLQGIYDQWVNSWNSLFQAISNAIGSLTTSTLNLTKWLIYAGIGLLALLLVVLLVGLGGRRRVVVVSSSGSRR